MDRAVGQINEFFITGGNVKGIAATASVMIGVAFVSMLFMLASAKVSVEVGTRFTADLRKAMFAQACDMSVADIKRIGVTAMLDRSTFDISGLMDFLSVALNVVVVVPVYIVVGCVMAFTIDGVLASLMVVFIPLIIVMIVVVTKIVRPLAKRSNMYLDRQNAIVHERLTGIRVIRAFNREPYEHERMAKATDTMADNFVKTNVTTSLAMPIATLVMNIVTVLVLAIGAGRITSGAAITTGAIVQLLQYLTMIMNALFTTAFAIMSFPRVRVSISRMNEVLDCKRIPRHAGGGLVDGSVSALDVSYHYPDSTVDALSGVTFSASPGEKIALIGGTGSGKSTFLTMLTGMTKPTGGTLVIGGRSAENLTVDEISGSVATVFQKSDFFTASLRENLDPLGNYSDDELFSALDCAEFGDFVRKVGLDYRITQNGNNLSGGQKQRLALARAFLKNAVIYLFDDSFSALDYLTEKRVRSNMAKRLEGKTCVIATQRVSTAYNCDKILLFDGGRLVAAGTHARLMNNEIYREIYISQTGGEHEEQAK